MAAAVALPTGCPRSPARLGRLTPFPNGFRLSTGLRRAGAAPGGAPHPTPLRCCCRCVWRRGFPAAMASQTWRGGGGYYTAARSCSLPVKRTPHGRGRRLPRSPPPAPPAGSSGRCGASPAPGPPSEAEKKRCAAPLARGPRSEAARPACRRAAAGCWRSRFGFARAPVAAGPDPAFLHFLSLCPAARRH